MPTDAERTAALEAIKGTVTYRTVAEDEDVARLFADAALTAAEKVRGKTTYKCANCSDFLEARTQPDQKCPVAGCPQLLDVDEDCDYTDCPRSQPETGQPIPDEAVEAAEAVLIAEGIRERPYYIAATALTDALPHLYREWAAGRTFFDRDALVRADTLAEVRERVINAVGAGKYDGDDEAAGASKALRLILTAIGEGDEDA
jgi:hypothetical protein